jgi:antitoxin component YwqK of YwqJK toxin-antitoxin module
MMRALLLCLVLSACGERVERVRVLDHQQRPSAMLERRDGIKDGPVTLFWPNGTTRTRGQYLDDRREGWWRSYHMDGSHRSLTHYVHGMKDGPRIYWDSLGRPSRAEVFVSGVPNGPFYRYFPDGRMAQHSYYVDGMLEGPHDQWYDDSGGSHVKGFYHTGQEVGIWTEHDTSGRLIWQAYLKDGEVTRALYGKRRRH